MMQFVIGMLIGALLGFGICALMAAAKDDAYYSDEYFKREGTDDSNGNEC